MKSRILVTITMSLLAASQVNASILSASGQAIQEPSQEASGQWTATTLQHELNASLRDAADYAAPGGTLTAGRAPVTGGLLVSDRATYTPFAGSAAFDDLLGGGSGGTVTSGSSGRPPQFYTSGGRGDRDRDRDRDRNRGRERGRDRHRDRDKKRDRPNPYATPEPSTWVLLGSGLLLMGAYVGLQRRNAWNF